MPTRYLRYALCCYCLTAYALRQNAPVVSGRRKWFVDRSPFSQRLSAMSAQCNNEIGVLRLGAIAGTEDMHTDVIFCGEQCSEYKGEVVFFGGDVQDYPEVMMSHRDNKRYVDWNLEKTAVLLSQRFPQHRVWVIKPYKMQLKTFSVYSNFVESDDVGCPNHHSGQDSWRKLYTLLNNAEKKRIEIQGDAVISRHDVPIILVAFSKGCIVLNQLLHDLKAAREDDALAPFVKRVKALYWLDGGHNGGSKTWITSDEVLASLSGLDVQVFVNVTPYQMKDPLRKWIGQEEKRFVDKLQKLGVNIKEIVHFADAQRCIENHFGVLKVF